MERKQNMYLIAGAIASGVAALLHIGCILFGASWYRFMGAGEQMAQMAEAGFWYPSIVTSLIAGVLFMWSLYALSGAGVIRRLPLLRTGLCAIAGIYILRGTIFIPLASYFPGNSMSFWLWSSAICLSFGAIYVIGIVQVWPSISRV